MRRLLAVLISVVCTQLSCIGFVSAQEETTPQDIAIQDTTTQETVTESNIDESPAAPNDSLENNDSVPPALTSENYQLKKETASTKAGTSDSLGELLLGLSAVIGLIVLLAWAAKRLNINNMSQGTALKLQSVLSLGTKEKIVIVEADGHKLLLGVTPHNITLLRQLENKESLQTEQVPMTGTFAKQIKKALSQGKFSEDTKSS
ncbi:MAG: flagellar biosynthetic protein FliO [Pseudomonadales bacterium]|nr:flagellar biosynthetic protein FliO [Pseudomonadales bacterium]